MSPPLHLQLLYSPWYASIAEEFQQFILERHQTLYLHKGQILFYRGQEDDGLYAVLEGAVNLGFSDAEGNESLMLIAEPILWFGEISLIDGKARTHDAITARNTTLLHLDKHQLLHFLNRHPQYWQSIALLLSQKMRPLLQVLESNQLDSLQQRLARRLLMILQSYGSTTRIQQHKIDISQEKLALMLSTSRQTINTLLQQLEQQKILKREFKLIHILDLARLQHMAGDFL